MIYKNGHAPPKMYDEIGVWAEAGTEGLRYWIDHSGPTNRGIGSSWLELAEAPRPHLTLVPDIGEAALEGADAEITMETAKTA